jgi:phosphopantetheinyl transferase
MQPPPSPVVLEYLDLDTPALALPSSSLDSAERERAARFHFDEDRRRFIAVMQGGVIKAGQLTRTPNTWDNVTKMG